MKKGIQFSVYQGDNCFSVTGKDKLLQLVGQFETYRGALAISARSIPSMKIPASVCVFIADRIYRGEVAVFSYLGESYPITDADDFYQLLRAVNTHRLYLDGEVIKTSATTYSTVFRDMGDSL